MNYTLEIAVAAKDRLVVLKCGGAARPRGVHPAIFGVNHPKVAEGARQRLPKY